jgi:hypothetical protein
VRPFWAKLPFIDVDAILTPDILHQLHKGMFTHLLSWTQAFMSKEEVDRQFRSLLIHSGLRHFGKGISHLTHTTGKEHKEMEKVLMAIIAGSPRIPPQASIASSALLNFIYFARYPIHTEQTLHLMDEALATFHQYKSIFIERSVCKDMHAIPKLHSLQHYTPSIRYKGSADGYSTEGPERLHIDFAKKGYRASNRNDYLKQMITWLERQEAINYQRSYLAWCDGYQSFIDARALDDDNNDNEWDFDSPGIDDPPVAPSSAADCPSLLEVPNPLTISHAETRLAAKPSFKHQTYAAIEDRHKVADFRWYLLDHMEKACPEIYSDRGFHERGSPLEVWSNFWLRIPVVRDLSHPSNWQRIPANPAHTVKSKLGVVHQVANQYGTVFALFGDDQEGLHRKYISLSTVSGLLADHWWLHHTGYRAAQVRVVFKLSPGPFHDLYPHPLAYVEYFTSFPRSVNKDTGLLTVKRAFRQNARHAAIIPLTHLHYPCHLIPSPRTSGTHSGWTDMATPADVLENNKGSFHLNPFITLLTHAFLYRARSVPMANTSIIAPASHAVQPPSAIGTAGHIQESPGDAPTSSNHVTDSGQPSTANRKRKRNEGPVAGPAQLENASLSGERRTSKRLRVGKN